MFVKIILFLSVLIVSVIIIFNLVFVYALAHDSPNTVTHNNTSSVPVWLMILGGLACVVLFIVLAVKSSSKQKPNKEDIS